MLNQLFSALILAQGVFAGLAALYLFIHQRAKLASFYPTWGHVVDIRKRPEQQGATIHPVIQYETLKGTQVTFESAYGTANWKVQVGDRLPILAHRNNSRQAEVAGLMVQWGVVVVLAIFSLASIIAAPCVYLALT